MPWKCLSGCEKALFRAVVSKEDALAGPTIPIRLGKRGGKGKGSKKSDILASIAPDPTRLFHPATVTGGSSTPQDVGGSRPGGGFDLTNVQVGPSFQNAQGAGGSTVNPLTSTSLDYLKGQDIESSLKLKQGRQRRKGGRSTE